MGPKSKFGTKKVPRDPSSIPGGDPKRFQDSSNHVFYIVGECFSGGAGTHLATDLTDKENNGYFLKPFFAFSSLAAFDEMVPKTSHLSPKGLNFEFVVLF